MSCSCSSTLVGRTRLAIKAGKQFNGFAHGELFRKPRFLQRDAQPLAHFAFILAPGVAENRDLARSRLQQPFQDFDGRGLPCPVRTEQTEALSGLNFKVQPAHGLDFAVVGLAQVAALNGYRHSVILPDGVLPRRAVRISFEEPHPRPQIWAAVVASAPGPHLWNHSARTDHTTILVNRNANSMR